MDYTEQLENYLIDKYLTKELSKGKITMLSGVWGSGKTYFWQNTIIEKLIDEKKNKIPNHYISLYGKTSIQEIKNEIFIKIFESVDSSKVEEKSKELTKNTLNLVSSFTKSISVFGVNVDLSKLTDKSFEYLDQILKDKKFKKTEEYLNDGAIICFDDFERKSKDIDLNDLFGFITQLTLNYDCRVVIILNSDVFSGKEKEIFTNVKEKSVSKYLSFAPTSDMLFEMIFKKYKNRLQNYENILKSTITEVNIVNARIYTQVLDNVVEWIGTTDIKDDDTLRCLILVNINFILNHVVFKFENYPKKDLKKELLPTNFFHLKDMPILGKTSLDSIIKQHSKTLKLELEVKDKIKDFMRLNNKNKSQEELLESIKQMDKYTDLFWIYWNFDINLEFRRNISNEQLNKINNFIETGIL